MRNKHKVPRVSSVSIVFRLRYTWDLGNATQHFQNTPFSIAEYDNHENSSTNNLLCIQKFKIFTLFGSSRSR